jgi:Contractile injection system tube protein
MTQSALGIVDKMRIEVFDKSDFKGTPKNTIFVQLNPEKYSMKQNVVFCEGQPIGASNTDLKFNKIDGEDVTFEFLFDSTGVVPPGKIKSGKGTMSFLEKAAGNSSGPVNANFTDEVKSVEVELEAFKNLLMGYNGDTHETAYLNLIWGGYSLECRLKSIEIEYYLFRNDGRPLRAKAKCNFKGTSTYKLMLATQKKSSPDLTHEREYTMNDKLSLMSETIYENSSFYIDVAQTNRLLSFRNIAVGTKIKFPPIK